LQDWGGSEGELERTTPHVRCDATGRRANDGEGVRGGGAENTEGRANGVNIVEMCNLRLLVAALVNRPTEMRSRLRYSHCQNPRPNNPNT